MSVSKGGRHAGNVLSNARHSKGKTAEDDALFYLSERRLTLIERNFRCRGGEIDLVMQDDEVIVFVEVRKRSSALYGGAAASVTYDKQARLILAASIFLQRYRRTPACRFDIVAFEPGGITWVRNAFEA